ncbi:hypothetical protein EMIT053CA3_20074 [Pseudomonas donghuensis]
MTHRALAKAEEWGMANRHFRVCEE